MHSLQMKFTILAIGLISAISITWGYFGYKSLERELDISIDERAYQLMSLLAEIGSVPLGEFDVPVLESFIEETKQDPNIIDAVYYDIDDEAVTSLNDLRQFSENSTRIYKQNIFSESRANEKIGYITLSYSLEPLNKKLEEHLNNSITRTIVFVVITAILLNILFVRLVNTRIRTLLKTVSSIGENDFSNKTNDLSEDEIGRLGRQVDNTARKLETTINQLNDKKDMIEYFIRILSHDICNSLAIAGGQISRIRKNKVSLEQGLEKMEKSINQTFKIVETVRYWMAQKDNKLSLNEERINIEEIYEHIDFTFKDRFEEKEIKIKYTNKIPENVYIKGDRNAVFFQIVDNMISNAIKYSEKSSEIHISSEYSSEKISIIISDFGSGFNPSIIKNIFSPHHATNQKGTLNETGTGFGMPIAKALMEKMSGDISVRNRIENGKIMGADVLLTFPSYVTTKQNSKIAS